jgi:competence ComEA-like helix-hairpin-helix protein
MIQLNSQQRNVLLVIIIILAGGLVFRMAERQRQAMAFDIKGLLDGYKHSIVADTNRTDTSVATNALKTDTSETKHIDKSPTKSKKSKSKQVTKLKPSEKININKAGVEDIQRLPGIGPVLAERIIAYRDSAGFFAESEDLLNVKGIGEKKLTKMEPHLEF